MTQRLKKIFVCSLLLCHNMGCAGDKPEDIASNYMAWGLTTLGVSLVGCVGWLGFTEYQKQAEINLNEKAEKLVAAAKSLLATKAKYGQNFDAYLSESGQNEAGLESCAAKLGINIDHINQYQRFVIPEDMKELAMLKKDLRSLNLANRQDVVDVHRNVTLYLENAKKLSVIFEKHKNFFDGHAALNFYATLPTNEAAITDWVYGHAQSELYPLSHYKDTVDREIASLNSKDMSQYPKLTKKSAERKEVMKKSLVLLYQAGKIQLEAQVKYDNELKAKNLKIAEEENQIKRDALQAEKIKVDALMLSARNAELVQENEREKIVAITEQNRVALLRVPVDQENNRLIAERNRLAAENNRIVAEQSRLQAERLRIESMQADNKRREIIAVEDKNKLQKERNQLERERLELDRQNVLYQQQEQAGMPTPSAPPAPANYQQNIPTATAVPVDPNSARIYPQVTGVYVDKDGRPL